MKTKEASVQHLNQERSRRFLFVTAIVIIVLQIWFIASDYWEIISRGGEAWQTGDWLINYSGGFVRRGGIGENLFASLEPKNILVATFIIQIGFLVAFCAMALTLYWKSPKSPAWFALTLSPAFLLFPFLSPEGGLRKELFVLVAAGWFALALRFRWSVWSLTPVVPLFLLGSFSHEITALMLPYFIFILVIGVSHKIWDPLVARVFGALLAVITLVSLILSLLNPGSPDHVLSICADWTESGVWRDPDVLEKYCQGSLSALGDTPIDALRNTVGLFPAYFSLITPVALASVPFIFLRIPRSILILTIVLAAASVPLFILAEDYGRWIFVIVSMSSFASLASHNVLKFNERKLPAWAALAFISLWSIPYSGVPTGSSLFTQVLTPPFQWISQWAASIANFSN